MNCVENLPVYAAIVLCATAARTTGPLMDELSLVMLGARVCQTTTHISFEQTDRVAAIRAAFEATIKDPAFLAMAQKRQVDVEWRDHQHTMSLVKKIVGASPDLIARVKKSIGQDE